jgi:hypothetical protein
VLHGGGPALFRNRCINQSKFSDGVLLIYTGTRGKPANRHLPQQLEAMYYDVKLSKLYTNVLDFSLGTGTWFVKPCQN